MYRAVVIVVVVLTVPTRAQTLSERLFSLFYRQTCEDLRQSLMEVDTLSDCSKEIGCPLNQHCESFTCQGLFVRRCVSNFALGAACQRSDQCISDFCHPDEATCQAGGGSCPSDMLNAAGTCLGLSPFRAASWSDARAACPALFGAGAALVSPASVAEQRNLQTFLVLRAATGHQPYIGVSDTAVEGVFTFDTDGRPIAGVFSAFRPVDLVNNDVSRSCATLRPVQLDAALNGWQLERCDLSRSFVCQRPLAFGA